MCQRNMMKLSETSTRHEHFQNQEPDRISSPRRWLQQNQNKWWISVSLCICIISLGNILVMLLLNFFYVQIEQDPNEIYDQALQYKGTWTQALIQNAAFLILIPLFFICPKPKQNPETNIHTPSLLFLYLSLGVLVAAHSKLFALGKLYGSYGVFSLISATQIIFTAIFTPFINSFKFTRWIVISIILTIVVYVFGIPEFVGGPDDGEIFYNIQAWLTLAASVAFALSLCLVQLGFEKLLVKTKRYGNKKGFRMVFEMQICVSFVASLVCVIGLFASGEYKEIKSESERFKKGEEYYILSLVGLALSWQVWAVGLIGLVLYVSAVFGCIVHMCASPLMALIVVLVFDFRDDFFSWPRIGSLIGILLALGSYFYTLYKKKIEELYQSENNIEV